MTVFIVYSRSRTEMSSDYLDSVFNSREAAMERIKMIPTDDIKTHTFEILEYAVQRSWGKI